MSELLRILGEGLRDATSLDLANLVLGIVGVVLMIRRSLWAFPIGLVSVTVQGVLFYHAKYFADATVQVFFFGALVYGWWHWVKHRGAAPELPVTRMSVRAFAYTLALAVAATMAWGYYLRTHTSAVMPYRDAFIAAFSVTGQILQSRKKLENWAVWTVVNIAAILAYGSGGLTFTAILYFVYLLLGLTGWRAWHRARALEETSRA